MRRILFILGVVTVVSSLTYAALLFHYGKISTNVNLSLSPNWVLWLKFDEGNGSIAHDSTKYGNDFDVGLEGKVRWISERCVEGSCIEFNSSPSSGMVYKTDKINGNFSRQLTIMMWYKPYKIPNPDNDKAYLFSVNPGVIELQHNLDNKVTCKIRNYTEGMDRGDSITSSSTLTLNKFNLIACIVDLDNNITLIVWNTSTLDVAVKSISTSLASFSIFSKENDFGKCIGIRYSGSSCYQCPNCGIDGVIDFFQIFNTTLTIDEIWAEIKRVY